ncbi:MAG TPA: hypothetical protein VGE39_20090 [Prosthecobacter sp.]
MKTIDRAELQRWTSENRVFALMDVLPDDAAGAQMAGGLPHAHSQADFMDQVTRLRSHQEQPVVLYEAASASVHFSAAAAMLQQAGFGAVYRFVGPQSALHGAAHGAPLPGTSA